MYMATTKGYIRGLDELEGDIRCKYSYDSHAQLKQTTILSRFIKEYELETQYDLLSLTAHLQITSLHKMLY